MPTYELIFVVTNIGEEREERLLSDGISVATMGRMQLAFVDSFGDSFDAAATRAIGALTAERVRIERGYLDLVTKSEIAERAGVTKQAVAKWVKKTDIPDPFPVEFDHGPTGPLWEWGKVNEWLRRTRKAGYDGHCSPDNAQVMRMTELAHQAQRPHVTAHFTTPLTVQVGNRIDRARAW